MQQTVLSWLSRTAPVFLAMTLAACAGQPITVGKAVGVVTSGDGAKVVLYDGSGLCVRAARYAEHVPPKGEKTPGCWVATNGGWVLVSFLDGERGNIPTAHLKRVLDL